MVLHVGGGTRMSPEAFITGLLSAAFLRIHYLRLPREERHSSAGYSRASRSLGGQREASGYAPIWLAG